MNVRYRVDLNQDEREQLDTMLRGGKHAARKLKRAQILLAAEAGETDEAIAANVSVGLSTIYRTKRRFVLGNLEAALSEAPRPGAARKLSAKQQALLVATACATPPAGRSRWTLELLADEMVTLTDHADLSRETVRRCPAENDLKPWRKDMWCIPEVDGTYVARMEDVLDLYAEKPDPRRPVVCFDESPTQLIGETRLPIPPEPGKPERYDCEYRRNGTTNLFVFLDAHRPWREAKVTDRRTAADFAHCMRDLVDTHYPPDQAFDQRDSTILILHIRPRDFDREQPAIDVHRDVAFAANNLLSGIIAAFTVWCIAFDRLGINDGQCGAGLAARLLAVHHDQLVVDPLHVSAIGQQAPIVIANARRGQVLRHRVPRDAITQDVADAVHDFTQCMSSGTPLARRYRKKWLDDCPLLIGHITWVSLTPSIIPTAVCRRPNHFPAPIASKVLQTTA